eukprot:CAMPEP_0170543346 /NCGR_PEP_ID=MMETSP0211-20121228/2485_1 /TAXON_ID=311385 /ORGANISM="Pseudokeronopsis sp., Strain OXSARD2" /LENGTH=107 /DNA_ID=CAMNT_0010846685 /DNA_START=1036 /DNA_END=1359 /DNA_ORIENTATION=-
MIQTLSQLKDPSFIRSVHHAIVEICTKNDYENVTDFEWFLREVVFVLGREKEQQLDKPLSQVLIDISKKKEDVRQKMLTKHCFEELNEHFGLYFIEVSKMESQNQFL